MYNITSDDSLSTIRQGTVLCLIKERKETEHMHYKELNNEINLKDGFFSVTRISKNVLDEFDCICIKKYEPRGVIGNIDVFSRG